MITEALKLSGYVVASATDGFKAIAACKVRMPDLILLDTHMPLMSGMDVYNRLRNEEKTKDIPIIFFSQQTEEGVNSLPKELGEQDIIVKPIQPSELLTRVKTSLRVKTL